MTRLAQHRNAGAVMLERFTCLGIGSLVASAGARVLNRMTPLTSPTKLRFDHLTVKKMSIAATGANLTTGPLHSKEIVWATLLTRLGPLNPLLRSAIISPGKAH